MIESYTQPSHIVVTPKNEILIAIRENSELYSRLIPSIMALDFQIWRYCIPESKEQKLWLWFFALCLGGLSATFILATLVRFAIAIY